MLVSQIENELFKPIKTPLGYSNLSKEEWEAVRTLADDSNIVIKKADKGSCVVIWDRSDYITEAESHFRNELVYKNISFKQDMLCNLVTKSNSFFKDHRRSGCIMEKELKYFSYEYKKIANLEKLYLLPKIHKRLQTVPGRPVISNCGIPAEKLLKFLDYYLKPVIQGGRPYIIYSGDFLKKIKNLCSLPENVILVTAGLVSLYPSIPHKAFCKHLKRH